MTRAFGLLLLLPLAGFALEAISGSGEFVFPARAWGLTLAGAASTAALSIAVGVPAGWFLAGGGPVRSLAALPLLLPTLLAAACWMALGLPIPGLFGCAVIHGAVYWPVVALAVGAALARIPRPHLDAADLQLSRTQILRLVVWPHARRPLLAAAGIVFLLSASEFTVPATFAVPTLSVVIYERLSAFQFAAAAWAGLPMILAALAFAIWVRRIPLIPKAGAARFPRTPALTAGAWVIATAAWILSFGLPVALFVNRAGTLSAVLSVWADFGVSIVWSAGVAAAVAAILVTWSSLSARRSAMEPLWLAALFLPGIVPALGLAALSGRLGLPLWFMDSGALLALALMSRFAAVAWLPLRDAVERSHIEAGELSGMSRARIWRKIVLPAALPKALAAGAIVFFLALAEIGPAVLLSPPGRQTVALHLFNWMHYGYDETVASLSLMLVGTVGAVWSLVHVGCFRRNPIAV
ncbi:MAG: hypothetical protein HY716_03705 [Planctomycetes bacterium]|nr:hypothetical protein [Planctomycetota bacterium]